MFSFLLLLPHKYWKKKYNGLNISEKPLFISSSCVLSVVVIYCVYSYLYIAGQPSPQLGSICFERLFDKDNFSDLQWNRNVSSITLAGHRRGRI